MMSSAFEDFTISIHLAQFFLRIFMIATVNHQLVQNQANSRANTESVFGDGGGMHQKALSSHVDGPSICSAFWLGKLFV